MKIIVRNSKIPNMIDYEQALELILKNTNPLGKKRVDLDDSLGCGLAQEIIARNDTPPFAQSAMDGFAVQAEDINISTTDSPICLPLIGTIQAGDATRIRLKRGTAIKIMTGARIPPGADAVVMKEFCTESGNSVSFTQSVQPGENIRRRGEEYQKGQHAIASGLRITPPMIGLLATLGYPSVWVYEKPGVALIVNGNELLPPGARLKPAMIRDSNSYALSAALTELGIENIVVDYVNDKQSLLENRIHHALNRSDVVITVGGISVGDYDLVKTVLSDLGVNPVFWQVAIKPGKPTYFGIYTPTKDLQKERLSGSPRKQKLVFGLPGNPVSALISYHQFVKPALLRMMGIQNVKPFVFSARLTQEYTKKPGRMDWVHASLVSENGELSVIPTSRQGSHMVGGLAQADCIISVPESETGVSKNSFVTVQQLEWRK